MRREHPFRHALYDEELTIRLCGPSDMPDVEAVWSHPSFMLMFPEYDLDGAAPDPEWLGVLIRRSIGRRRVLAIETNEHGLIGTLVVHLSHRGSPSLGWYVVPEHRSKGYATRAAWMAANQLDFQGKGICVSFAADNIASRRVWEKIEDMTFSSDEDWVVLSDPSTGDMDNVQRPTA